MEFTFNVEKNDSKRDRFVLSDGEEELGYMTFKEVHDEGIIVDHTIVHESAQGQGVGGKLLEQVTAWIAERGLYLVPVCPYVFGRLQKYPEKGDTRAVPRGPL